MIAQGVDGMGDQEDSLGMSQNDGQGINMQQNNVVLQGTNANDANT
jgi:hypothetical protein